MSSVLYDLLTKFRRQSQMKRNVWDDLYDLYCHMEERYVSQITFSKDEAEAKICFSDTRCDPSKLERLKGFLGPECGDYFRFLEFYNGLSVGQWHLLGCEDIDELLPNGIREVTKIPMMWWDIDYDNASADADADDSRPPELCYIAKTGIVLIYVRDGPAMISHSFEEFMNECVLGPRYLEFKDREKEDATYRFLQSFLKIQVEAGVNPDKRLNPTRDPRIMTGYRRFKFEKARHIYEQTKDLPPGTPFHFDFEKGKGKLPGITVHLDYEEYARKASEAEKADLNR